MKAVYYEEFGPAEKVLQIGEKSLPDLQHGEVSVEIKCTGVNPSDVKKRAGLRAKFSQKFIIPHSDGSGVIVDVAKGVSKNRIGQRVWLYEAQHNRSWGSASQMINIPSNQAIHLPDRASFPEGAAIGIPMMTAHRCVTCAGDIGGKTLLITGGMGRVAYYAIQFAKHLDSRVVVTVGDENQFQEIYDLGADLVVSYNDMQYPNQIMDFTKNSKLDLVVDVEFGQNLESYLPLLKENATIATYSSSKEVTPKIPFYDLLFKNAVIYTILVYSMPDAAKKKAIRDITAMLKSGMLKHRIAKEFWIDEIVRAHEAVEQGRFKGSVILKF